MYNPCDNPCEYCQYASNFTDITGKVYYQCDLDDDPDNYPDAVCCGGNDGVL